MEISQEIFKTSILDMSLKMANFRLPMVPLHLPDELTAQGCWVMLNSQNICDNYQICLSENCNLTLQSSLPWANEFNGA